MFDAEKILGGLLLGGTRGRSSLDSLIPGGAGMALLGVAIEAFEHFTKKPGTGVPPPPPPPGPPPRPGSAPSPGTSFRPVPPPPGSPSLPEANPPAPSATSGDPEALLLVRAMIAVAAADGTVSTAERSRILDRMDRSNLSAEEQTFLEKEFSNPANLETLAAGAGTAEKARRIYAVSLLAIRVDTEAERNYLQALAGRLGLDGETIAGIQRDLGL